MNLRRALGVASSLASRTAGKLLSFLFIVVLARLVEPAEFAAYSYLITLALTFYVLSDTGVGLIVSREVAGRELPLGPAYRSGLAPMLAGNLIGAVALGVFGVLDSGPGTEGWPLVFVCAYVVAAGLFAFQAGLLRARHRLGLEALLQTAGSVLLVGVGTAVVLAGLGLTALMAAFALKQIVMIVVAQVFLPWPFSSPPVRGLAWSLLRRGILLGAASTGLVVMLRVSIVAISNFGTVLETAQYSVAFRFFEFQQLLAATFAAAVFPTMSERYSIDRPAGERLMRRMLLVTVVTCVLVTIPVLVIVPGLVVLVFGERYEDSAAAAQILVAGLPVLAAYMLCWYALAVQRRERWVLASATVGVIASVALAMVVRADPTSATAAWTALAGYSAGAGVAFVAFLRPTRPSREESTAVSRGGAEPGLSSVSADDAGR